MTTSYESKMNAAIRECDGHLGDLVSWSLRIGPGGVDPTELVRRATDAGLDQDYLPKLPPAESAMRRAMRDVARSDKNLRSQIIIDNPGVIVWAVSRYAVDESTAIGQATGQLVNRIGFSRLDSTIAADDEDDPTVDQARQRQQFHATRLTRPDVFAMINRLLAHWKGVSLPTIGLHFVQPAHADEVRKLRDVIDGLNGCSFFCLPLPMVDEAKRAVGGAARDALSKEAATIRDELLEWQAEGHEPGDATLARRLETVSEIRDRAAALLTLTSTVAGDLTASLDGLEGDIRRAITGEPDLPATETAVVETTAPATASEPDAPAARPAPPAKPKAPGNGVPQDLDSLTVKQLRRIMRKRGVSYAGMNKIAMVARLRAEEG